ncbi:PH domain-containing protein [Rutstroemia sp. NJR-2017a BVV2]|nr:PH domain-containing protein [Rutstroemia sp. NJR-2017a BVV2]
MAAWKPIFLVLRPNYLSIYKDANEDKLRHKIHLADLTAVAFLKDPKQKRRNVFGLFTPSRNYHLEATTKGDAEQWVELIRKEARIEEEEEEMLLASPGGNITGSYAGFDQSMTAHQAQLLQDERLGSSSPEPTEPIVSRSSTQKNRQRLISPMGRRPSHTMDYSGNELVSDADLSDTDLSRFPGASQSLDVKPPPASSRAIMSTRNASQMSIPLEHDPERVIWQGYLLYLRSKNGIRQWKDVWVVLRPKTVSIYKNDSEYSPVLILPFENVINVVEIDPLSRTKRHCLQMIGEEKSYKFCAHGEDELDRCLGAFKSLLARRKEGGKVAAGPVRA